jgi:hypothetical protein
MTGREEGLLCTKYDSRREKERMIERYGCFYKIRALNWRVLLLKLAFLRVYYDESMSRRYRWRDTQKEEP